MGAKGDDHDVEVNNARSLVAVNLHPHDKDSVDRNKTDLHTETLEEQNTKTIKPGNVKSTANESSNENLTDERTIKHDTAALKTFGANVDKMDNKKPNDVSKITCDNLK